MLSVLVIMMTKNNGISDEISDHHLTVGVLQVLVVSARRNVTAVAAVVGGNEGSKSSIIARW